MLIAILLVLAFGGSLRPAQLKSIFDMFPATAGCENCWKASSQTNKANHIVFQGSELGLSTPLTAVVGADEGRQNMGRPGV